MDISEKIKLSLKGRKVAYFSMEIGLNPQFSNYSGGLGILAGDTVKSSADLNLPMVAVTLINKKGYFRQELTPQGKQIEYPDEWHPEKHLIPVSEQIELKIEGRIVKIKAWLYLVESSAGGRVPVFFLDTDVEGNTPEDRDMTAYLYGGDQTYRIKQEIVLGMGGLNLLHALNIEVMKYHLNEGHASFLLLELLQLSNMDIDKIKNKCVFTTHTPIEAGHDRFAYDKVMKILPPTVPLEMIQKYAGKEHLNMTLLALNLCGYVNGVAKKHGETTRKMFPGYEIRSITNGVHPVTWTHPIFKQLYDKYLPGWANEPELLVRVGVIPNQEIKQARTAVKKEFIDYVNTLSNQQFSPDICTIGFARRVTAYKRHTLIFSDLDRLRTITKKYPLQIIYSGKAHPHDEPGKRMIEEIYSYIDKLKNDVKIIYIPNYNMDIARGLTSGVDIWLNTPQRPLEASGTSGMKAIFNGVINFSVLDGWWVEGCIEGVTGWSIGPGADVTLPPEEIYVRERHDLYGKLEYNILPLFYERNDMWLWLIENSIEKNAHYFNTHRMMRHYMSEAYFINGASCL